LAFGGGGGVKIFLSDSLAFKASLVSGEEGFRGFWTLDSVWECCGAFGGLLATCVLRGLKYWDLLTGTNRGPDAGWEGICWEEITSMFVSTCELGDLTPFDPFGCTNWDPGGNLGGGGLAFL
jgi:hypothetical protein